MKAFLWFLLDNCTEIAAIALSLAAAYAFWSDDNVKIAFGFLVLALSNTAASALKLRSKRRR